jgi:hypothetical protein
MDLNNHKEKKEEEEEEEEEEEVREFFRARVNSMRWKFGPPRKRRLANRKD